jgi:hypothetical protein
MPPLRLALRLRLPRKPPLKLPLPPSKQVIKE